MAEVILSERTRARPLRFAAPELRGVGSGMTGLFNFSDLRPANALTGRAVSLIGMTGNPQVTLRDGPALQANIFGGTDFFTTATLEAGTSELVPGTDATFVWVGSVFSLTYGGVMCRGDDVSGNGSSLRLSVTSAGEAQFSYVDTAPAATTATTSGAGISVNENIVIVATKRGNTVSVYCKGRSASASGGNSGLRTSGRGVSLNFAGSSGNTATGGAANHLMAATFGRALNAGEARALIDNPWQLFRSPSRLRSIEFSSGAGGVTATALITESTDTAAGAASVALSASGVIPESADSVVATATVTSGVVGSAAITEASDSATGGAAVALSAAGSASEASDTVSASSALAVVAQGSATEAPDSLVAFSDTDTPAEEVFARAPAGGGYAPSRTATSSRPAEFGGARPSPQGGSRAFATQETKR